MQTVFKQSAEQTPSLKLAGVHAASKSQQRLHMLKDVRLKSMGIDSLVTLYQVLHTQVKVLRCYNSISLIKAAQMGR